MTTALAVPRTRITKAKKNAIRQSRASGNIARRDSLPEYLDRSEIEALMQLAPSPLASLLMLIQWRAGLRVAEAVSLTAADFELDGDRPCLRVRMGKGNKARVVPVHPELGAAIRLLTTYGRPRGALVGVHPATAWRWVQKSYVRAQELNQIAPGRKIGTHTLRHSAARHWLASGVPINVVSRWLGHASIQTTLVYLEILPDPVGYMDRVE